MVSASAATIAIGGAGVGVVAHAQDLPGASGQASASDADSDDKVIVVTGRRAALQSADDRKKNANVIVDSVVADEAGKLPDNSITEVLQRVAGVTIVRFAALGDPDHFSVEGSGIQVRGLTGVASRLNGRDIFSANSGRTLLWGDVTPELMKAVDVYKSSSAAQIEGGTGGSVDLRTKLPFDYSRGWHFAGSGDISMGDMAKATDYSGSGLVTGNWDTGIGRIGFLIDGAYSKFTSTSDFFRIEPYFKQNVNGTNYYVPGGYDYGEETFQRKRDGLYGAVQWQPSDSLTLTGIYFQSRYRNNSHELGSFVTSQYLVADPSASKFDANNALISSTSLYVRDPSTFGAGSFINSGGTAGGSVSNSKTQDFSGTIEWAPVGSHLAVRGGFQHVLSTSTLDRIAIFRDFLFPSGMGMDLSNGLPVISLPSSFPTSNFVDPSQYLWTAAMPHNEKNRGTMNTANFDLEYTFDDDDFFKSVKAGGRWSDRSERDLNNQYAWAALGRGWNGVADWGATNYAPQMSYANAAPGDVSLNAFKNFFHGGAVLPGIQLYPSVSLVDRALRDPGVVFGSQQSALDSNGFLTGMCGENTASNSLYFNCSSAGPASASGYGPGKGGRQYGFVLPDDAVDFSTKTLAGYIEAAFARGPISGNVGARVVRVKNYSSGYLVQQSGTQFILNGDLYTLATKTAPRSGGKDYTRVLPAINVAYSPSDPVKIRAAYSITMDNPSFSALSAYGSIGVATTDNPGCSGNANCNLPGILTNFTSTQGLPSLNPAMSNNFDLSFEWYPKSGTTLHLAAFYKRLTNLTIYSRQDQAVSIDAYNISDGGVLETINTTLQASNAHNSSVAATVKGVEIGGRWFFDNVPGFLKGIGVEANYTFIDSKNPGDVYTDIDGNMHSDAPLQGLSKHNFNAALLYEHNPFSLRVAYSWRSKYLQSTNANGTNSSYRYFTSAGNYTTIPISLPVYGAAYGTLDAGVTIRVNDHFSWNVQASNILNSTAKTLMGGPNGALYTRSWFQSDRRINMGINVSF